MFCARATHGTASVQLERSLTRAMERSDVLYSRRNAVPSLECPPAFIDGEFVGRGRFLVQVFVTITIHVYSNDYTGDRPLIRSLKANWQGPNLILLA